MNDRIGRIVGIRRVATRGTASAVLPIQLENDPEGGEGGESGTAGPVIKLNQYETARLSARYLSGCERLGLQT